MTPLRQRFLDDLRLRNYSPRTVACYVRAVAQFALHFDRSPEVLGPEEIRTYQLHMLQEHTSWSQFNQAVCALRLLYRITLGRPEVVCMIPFGKRPKTLPVVLARAEVLRLFAALPDNLYRTLIRTTYACGLRIGEVVRLRVSDIDSQRGVLVVRQGKGQKDRLVPLSSALLAELRAHWQRYRPKDWLFPGKNPGQPLHITALQRTFARIVKPLGFRKHVSMHTLRHSYATHLLEAGVDVVTLQHLLGYCDLSTTANYLHVQTEHFERLASPLDALLAVPETTTATGPCPWPVADPAPTAGTAPMVAAMPIWVVPAAPAPTSHE